MTDTSEEWVLHNTRLRRSTARVVDLLKTAAGLSKQELTDAALAAYVKQYYPGLLDAVGDPEAERAAVLRLMSERKPS